MREILIAQYLPSFALSAFVAGLLCWYLLDMRAKQETGGLSYALATGLAIWSIGYAIDRIYWGAARLIDWQEAYSMHWPIIATHLFIGCGLYVIVNTWALAKNKPRYSYYAIAAYFALWIAGVVVLSLGLHV